MRAKSEIRAILILAVLGCFISAQEARPESVFQREHSRRPAELALRPVAANLTPSAAGGMMLRAAPMAADTIETVDIEVEQPKKHHVYKELAAVVIVTAVVTYALVTLLKPGDDGEKTSTSGKPTPFSELSLDMSVPINQ
jgi:hypothetical protein